MPKFLCDNSFSSTVLTTPTSISSFHVLLKNISNTIMILIETSDLPCDTPSPVDLLERQIPQLDLSPLRDDPDYPEKKGLYAFTKTAVLSRAQSALEALSQVSSSHFHP